MLLHTHTWSWPMRDRASGRDVQTCTVCGRKRESLVKFGLRRSREPQENAVSAADFGRSINPSPVVPVSD
jgi:hypothetical protein